MFKLVFFNNIQVMSSYAVLTFYQKVLSKFSPDIQNKVEPLNVGMCFADSYFSGILHHAIVSQRILVPSAALH